MSCLRNPEIVVLSDIHLGNFGCHAEELAHYLESIHPKSIILNGDIIDFIQMSWRFWPSTHMRVLELLTHKVAQGVQLYYLSGNHDDLLRKFSNLNLGHFSLLNKLVLNLNGEETWFFHGDVFDSLALKTKLLTRMGALGYDFIIQLNRTLNQSLKALGRPRYSLSKKIKLGIKSALEHVEDFEQCIAELALENGYSTVACGHIHAPIIKKIHSKKYNKEILYLNSGDWIESLTALEFDGKKWSLYEYEKDINQEQKTPPPKLHLEMSPNL
jgi:UDP-2,3-diacylglucosamine pyrophosphatase LpxH